MENVLIAYNNHYQTDLHSFYESCADEAKQICSDYGHKYSSVCPPNLNEQNVVLPMDVHTICFLAAHGDYDGVYNENDDDIVSIHTTNYNFNGKVFYSIACSCAKNLLPELKRIGLSTFVGYDEEFIAIESDPLFLESAMEGLRSLLSEDDKNIAKQKMLDKFDVCILRANNPWSRMYLTHNKAHLCFE